ncbi:DUF488 domain-containing protein [Ileibacterium valens]|nr:DUF488 family protein [Ileibacterium valens]
MNGGYMGILKIKRIYEPESPDDGYRILVDRLWPRGESKLKADLDEWAKQAAPSSEERKQFHQGNESFEQFKEAYLSELNQSEDARELKKEIMEKLNQENVTLLYGSKNKNENNAIVLMEWLKAAS